MSSREFCKNPIYVSEESGIRYYAFSFTPAVFHHIPCNNGGINAIQDYLRFTAVHRIGIKDTQSPIGEIAVVSIFKRVFSFLPGQEVLIDDGKISCRVISDASDFEKGRGRVYAEVLRGGILKDKKSIALPGADVWPPTLTKTDLINISAAREYGVTGLMQPFVRNAEDLKAVRAALDAAGAGYIRILAKIENQTGLSHIESLLPYADEFVIARGDLGNSMPLWELPAAQKRLARTVKKGGKQLMIVTQMLASMEHSRVPTRAEVCDIFNAVLDGADSVMVTGETAAGDYPADVIRYLANTAHEAEKFLLEGF